METIQKKYGRCFLHILKKNKKRGKSPRKERRIFVIDQFIQDNLEKKKDKGAKRRIKDCKTSYTGIGIVTNFMDEITYVAPGGPAYLAGIKPGDILAVSSSRIRNVYKAGTMITITVERNGIMKDIRVRVGKICTEEMERP